MGNEADRNAFSLSTEDIVNAANEYDDAGESSNFVELLPNDIDKKQAFLNGLSKEHFTKLYSNQLVNKEVPRKEVYDQLKSRAPYGKCPFCGYCDVDQLDHYLPKSKYPLLTVLPLNLVPSCPYCNGGKNAEIAERPEEQILHPYYDHSLIMETQWIFASVIHTRPAVIQYFVKTPTHFDPIASRRVANHFEKNNLAARYSTQAADQLSTLPYTLKDFYSNGGAENVREHLLRQYQAEYQRFKNSWQTAMYLALAEDSWFCSGGFR
ncbi:HNH endonuclease [Alteromonas stellipolaris]|uniref:HNH endonuclease n=1 Tax=Alteromonas stellipolaris TaxID=233316 RepID=UPI0026E298C3|nr:hypothetical protein [Alteromonas stellipolaris]MDO6534826.1 hypothetical protein [Alteromonas stellipolaris]